MGHILRFRKKIMPRTFADFSACVFISGAIFTIYWFEVFIVLPTLFGRALYVIHALLGTFILVNIVGNLLGILLIETSTRGLVLPSQVPQGWHVCAHCESVAPPRAKHCNICDVCILKREHHCVFTGCCVGLYNHRYFYIFLFYMWLATFYCSGLNAFFIGPYVGGLTWWAGVRLLLPGVWLIWNPSYDTLYAFLVSINVIGFMFLSVLFYYYSGLMLMNVTTQENSAGKPQRKYDRGTDHNIKVVLGSRWYITWFIPCISSPLPYDGLDWSFQGNIQCTRPKMK